MAGAPRELPETVESPTIEGVLDRMFLTPRIVDQRTYEELAAGLRVLVKDAAEQERSLREAGIEVKALGAQLRDASRELAMKIEGTAKPAGADDAALEKQVRTVVAKVLTREIEAQQVAFRSRLDAMIQEALAKAGESARTGPPPEDGSVRRQAEETLDRVRQAQGSLDAAADDVIVRVAALAEQVDGAAARVEAARLSLEDRGREVEARAADLVRIGDEIEAKAAAAEQRTERLASEAGVRLAAALAEADRRAQLLITGLEADLTDFERRARQAVPSVHAAISGSGLDGPSAATLAEARQLGGALSRLVREANLVGPALDRLVREAKERTDQAAAVPPTAETPPAIAASNSTDPAV